MTVPSIALMIEVKFVRTTSKILCMRCTSCEARDKQCNVSQWAALDHSKFQVLLSIGI